MPPRRILVVDDDPSILRLVATILRREKYHVDTANGGREALSKLESAQYDVIVLDLMMPDISGVDVLRSLEARHTRMRCVIVLSAASSLDVAHSVNSNVFSALRKPFDNEALVDAVRRCIDAVCDVPVMPAAA